MAAFNGSALAVLSIGEKALNLMGQSHVNANRACYLNSYWNRGDLKENRLQRQRENVIALYDASIRWVDAQAASLVEKLRELKLWESCVFALTADHGEEFLEHGGRYHSPAKLTGELIQVPLLLRSPGINSVRAVDGMFSLLHLGPTLLEAVGSVAPASFYGRSYWTQLQKGQNGDGPAIIECIATCNNAFRPEDRLGARILAVQGTGYQLVLDFRTGEAQLFDLKSDPNQQSPLPQSAEKSIRRRLLEVARKHISSLTQSRNQDLRLAAYLRNLRLEYAPLSVLAGLG